MTIICSAICQHGSWLYIYMQWAEKMDGCEIETWEVLPSERNERVTALRSDHYIIINIHVQL